MIRKPRVLLADDHTIVLEGLKGLLEPEFELVGAVNDGEALLKAAAETRPDVIVFDISMPGLNGIQAARELKKTNPEAKLLALTMHAEMSFVKETLRAGASGYLLKQSAASELATAIHEVLEGRCYMTPLIAKDVVATALKASAEPERTPGFLTERQLEVLRLVADGHSLKEIAYLLKISIKTVEFHKYRIMDELKIRTTAELTAYAIRHGLTPS